MMLDDVEVGDYVLIHAGFAIEKIDDVEAQLTLQALREALDQGLAPE
jgi:hydrogenase expression/formation protein HypC